MKIKWKIVMALNSLLLAIIILVGIIVNVKLTALSELKTDAELINYSKLGIILFDTNYPGDWRLEGNQLYKGDVLINENYEVVDRIAKDAGLMATIFSLDTRVSTTITDKSGNRMIGTQAAKEVINQVIRNGFSYQGKAQ